MQILMPIASRSQFFPEQEYFFPKPLIEIAGKPMIDCVVSALRTTIADARFCFIISADDARRFSLDETLMIVGGQGTKVIQRVGETRAASALRCSPATNWIWRRLSSSVTATRSSMRR